jgi:hypothetical protein
MTTIRHPLPALKTAWDRRAVDFYAERVAILAADGIPDAEKLAESLTRRWWAMGAGEMFMPPEW